MGVSHLSSHAAFIYSILSIAYSRVQAEYESHGLFFETSALLITFVCLGEAAVWAAGQLTARADSRALRALHGAC